MVKVDVFPAVFIVAPPKSLEDFSSLIFENDKPPETRRVDRCRVSLFNENIYVVVDDPEGFKIIFRERVTSYKKLNKQYNVLTETGKIAAFRKDDNCGCGSRLRSWSPFGNYVDSVEDPYA